MAPGAGHGPALPERAAHQEGADGSYRWHLLRAIPVSDGQGHIFRWFGTATDIEDQRQAIEMRDEFLSVASHELKTPLTALRLQLQMSRKKVKSEAGTATAPEKLASPLEDALKRSLDLSLQQTDRLIRLVEDLLDVSRIQAGKFEMNFEEVRAEELIKAVLRHHQFQLEAARCPIELETDAALTGQWDRSRIEQVLTNLLFNAIKYAPGKPIRLFARREGDMAVLGVQDQGPGVPEEKQAVIFERFERAVSARNVSGLGLGLFISRQIVQAHNGRVRIDSKPGEGSALIVELPLDPERHRAPER